MTAPQEQDPAARIVDVDTFAYYIIGYTSNVLARERQAKIMAEGEKMVEQMERYFEAIDDGELTRNVSIRNCPWEDVPDGLKNIITRQYEAASLEGWKRISVHIGNQDILVRLNSEFTIGSSDMHAEIDTLGLRLQFGEGIGKGFWHITKSPSTEMKELGKDFFAKDEETLNEQMARLEGLSSTESVRASLQELQDTARFLEKFKEQAIPS